MWLVVTIQSLSGNNGDLRQAGWQVGKGAAAAVVVVVVVVVVVAAAGVGVVVLNMAVVVVVVAVVSMFAFASVEHASHIEALLCFPHSLLPRPALFFLFFSFLCLQAGQASPPARWVPPDPLLPLFAAPWLGRRRLSRRSLLASGSSRASRTPVSGRRQMADCA